MKPGFIVIGKANCLVRPKLKSTQFSNDEESKPFGILPQKQCPPSFSREWFSIWLLEKLFSSGVCPTCPQLTRIMLAKVFRSRKMNVASAWLLHPGSSKQVNKQARLNWYTGECPSCETALIGLATKHIVERYSVPALQGLNFQTVIWLSQSYIQEHKWISVFATNKFQECQ